MSSKAKKILSGTACVVSAIIVVMLVFINTGPDIPGSEKIFTEIMKCDLPELVTGQTGFARNGKVKIWYELFTPRTPPRGTVLLIMGHSATSLRWQNFHSLLVKAGYRVIRFDNRGTGMSDRMKDWDKNNPYTLEDMASDAIAVLDKLRIEKAHIIGASMGGMIAQELAIHHPNRAASLTSIMSSGYMNDPELKMMSPQFIRSIIKITLKYRICPTKLSLIKYQTYLYFFLDVNHPYDAGKSALVARYEWEKHGGENSAAGKQHSAAIISSGSRYHKLSSIKVPTLIIHGKSDPIIPVEHAYKYAALIPRAKTLFIDGMGHSIPLAHIKEIKDAIFRNIE